MLISTRKTHIPSGNEELSEHTSYSELSCDEEAESAVTVTDGDVGSSTRQEVIPAFHRPGLFIGGKILCGKVNPSNP